MAADVRTARARTAGRASPSPGARPAVGPRTPAPSLLVLLFLLLLGAPARAQTLAPGGGPAPGATVRTGRSQAAPDPGDLVVGVVPPLALEVAAQQAVPSGVAGVDLPGSVVTFGLPFGRDEQVRLVGGRPALAVHGSSAFQFEVLDTWDNGSVRWALCDAVVDVPAGQQAPLTVRRGSGRSAGADVALDLETAPTILIDTGPLRVGIDKARPGTLASVQLDGVSLLDAPGPLDGLRGSTPDGAPLVLGPSARAVLEHNGPARAVVRIDGPLVDAAGQTWLDATLRLTARRGRRDLELTVTARNASQARWSHAVLESLTYGLDLVDGGDDPAAVRLAGHADPHQALLADDDRARLFLAQTDATVEGVESSLYAPHLPKLAPGSTGVELVLQGYRVEANGQVLHETGDPSVHPEAAWLTWSRGGLGVTASLRHGPWLFPGGLSARGDGRIELGFFPAQNPAPYLWVHGQHESRTGLLSFFRGEPDDERVVTSGLDWPVAARAVDYDHYDRAGVFPYDLITEAEHDLAYALMGIDHKVFVPNLPLQVTRYLYKGTSGPQNNHARIERLLAGEWLRHGQGGQYVTALDLALYKSEWQVQRSDDFVLTADLPPVPDAAVPHTQATFGDDQHRYRDGMILAYHLTGDARFQEALFDEAEVLRTVTLWPHERSMVQTLRALAAVWRFTDDEALGELLRERLSYVSDPLIDVQTASSGFGWDDLPGAGDRRYYANSGDLQSEKPPGEHFISRGFVSASLAPVGYHLAAEALGADPMAEVARGRLEDLAWWTREELFPEVAEPADRYLAYSYAVSLQEVVVFEAFDFHPVLFAMGRGFSATNDVNYLDRGVDQVQAFAAHDHGPYDDNLPLLDSRLDCQDFFATWLAWRLAQEP